jgi:heme oxygenase
MSLRELTAVKHKEAESHPFNRDMVAGKLKDYEYFFYLHQMYFVFFGIESKLVQFDNLYDKLPRSMLRVPVISKDVEELSIADHTPYLLDSTKDYVKHLSELDEEHLMAHVYLNYLALLFGGQIIKKSVPGTGAIYDFENPSEAIVFVRSQQKDEWADEVNKGFDYLIAIYDDLQDFLGRNSE